MAGIPGGSAVHAIADDTDGNVWIANQDLGLVPSRSRWRDRADLLGAVGSNDFASAMVADPVKGVWIGYHNGGIIHLAGGEIRESYSASDGLGDGRVNALRFDADGVLWAATAGGLSRLRGGKLATLNSKRGLPCDSVHWEIEGDAQFVWLYMSCALVRVSANELRAWAARANQDGTTRASWRKRRSTVLTAFRPERMQGGTNRRRPGRRTGDLVRIARGSQHARPASHSVQRASAAGAH